MNVEGAGEGRKPESHEVSFIRLPREEQKDKSRLTDIILSFEGLRRLENQEGREEEA